VKPEPGPWPPGAATKRPQVLLHRVSRADSLSEADTVLAQLGASGSDLTDRENQTPNAGMV